MKKAVYHGIRDIRIEEVPEPSPGSDEVKIKVQYCGICGSDLHEYLHGLFPESSFGHEICGEITAVGPGTTGFEVGDHVVASQKGGFAERMVASQDQVLTIPAGIGECVKKHGSFMKRPIMRSFLTPIAPFFCAVPSCAAGKTFIWIWLEIRTLPVH